MLFSSSTLSVAADDAAAIADSLLAIADAVPSSALECSEFDGDGMSVVDMVSRAIAASKSEALRRGDQGGGCGNERRR